MAADDVVLQLKVQADTSDADQDVKGFGDKLTSSFLKAELASKALTAALGLVKDGIKQGLSDALEYERTTIRLEAANKAFGDGLSTTVEMFQRQSNALEAVTGTSDEVIRSMQSFALNLGVSTDSVDKYIRAAMSMANVTGRDVNSSLEALIKTQAGVIDRTMKVIPGMKDLTKEELEAGKAIDLVNDRWGEFVDLQTRGGPGQIVKLQTAWGNFAEAVMKAAVNSDTLFESLGRLTRSLQAAEALINEGKNPLLTMLFWSPEDVETYLAANEQGGKNSVRMQGAVNFGRGPKGLVGVGEDGGFDFSGSTGVSGFDVGGDSGKKSSGGKATDDLGIDEAFAKHESFNDKVNELLNRSFDQRMEDRQTQLDQEKSFEEWRAQELLDIEATKNANIREIELRDRAELNAAILKDAEEQQAQLARVYQKGADVVGSVMNNMATVAIDSLFDWADGQGAPLGEIVNGFLKSTGMMLAGQGLKDLLTGVSRGLGSYGFDATAYGLMALGGVEVAAGTAMLAGSVALNAAGYAPGTFEKNQKAQESAASGGGGGGAGGSIAAGGIGSSGRSNGVGDRTIVVNINAGVMTSQQAGREIKRMIAEAERAAA